ncbi:MAG: twin-arginine translocation pathway signal protein [Candidatus Omnitrophica bacterium]|nr:twin-arginine translocation pathway signal protein [Candidatus Omnitrophota bacterium]MCA9437908.1 twin-arginine translocation pathway signal protein [Candidatus Omnitrophota bacterium]
MDRSTTRRGFLGAAGLGIAGLGARRLTLADATESAENPTGKDRLLVDKLRGESPTESILTPTEDNALGPFYIEGAPHRAKLTPPLEPGVPLLIRGQVWSLANEKPIPMAVLDVWQANAAGEYDNRKTSGVTTPDDFHYRARMLTDENGYYEFETIHPGAYQLGRSQWRPSHIHYLIQAPGHQTLITQLYFKGDPRNEPDSLFKPSLAIDVAKVKTANGEYEAGVFDIVLKAEGA